MSKTPSASSTSNSAAASSANTASNKSGKPQQQQGGNNNNSTSSPSSNPIGKHGVAANGSSTTNAAQSTANLSSSSNATASPAVNAHSAGAVTTNWAKIAAAGNRANSNPSSSAAHSPAHTPGATTPNLGASSRNSSNSGQPRNQPQPSNPGHNPNAQQQQHNRKPAAAVHAEPFSVAAGGKAVPIKPAGETPGIAFGSLADSNATLSSSPAQRPPMMSNAEQRPAQFGSLAASTGGNAAVAAPKMANAAKSATTATPAAPAGTVPKMTVPNIDFNKFFQQGGDNEGSPEASPAVKATSTATSGLQQQQLSGSANLHASTASSVQGHPTSRRPSTYENASAMSPRALAAGLPHAGTPGQSGMTHHMNARPFSPAGMNKAMSNPQTAAYYQGQMGMPGSPSTFAGQLPPGAYGGAPPQGASGYAGAMPGTPGPAGAKMNGVQGGPPSAGGPRQQTTPYMQNRGVPPPNAAQHQIHHQHNRSIGSGSPRPPHATTPGQAPAPSFYAAQAYANQQWQYAGYPPYGYNQYGQAGYYPQGQQPGQPGGRPSLQPQHSSQQSITSSPVPSMRPGLSPTGSGSWAPTSSEGVSGAATPSTFPSSGPSPAPSLASAVGAVPFRPPPHLPSTPSHPSISQTLHASSPSFTPSHPQSPAYGVPVGSPANASLNAGASSFSFRPPVLGKAPSKALQIKKPPSKEEKEKADKEKADKEKAEQEKADKEKADQDKAAKDKEDSRIAEDKKIEDDKAAAVAAADKKVADDKAAVDKKVADDKAAADKKVADDKAVDDKKAADDKAAADKKVAEEKTAADKKVADEKTAADKKVADEKTAADKKAADEKTAADKAKKDQEEREVQEKLDNEKKVREQEEEAKRVREEEEAQEKAKQDREEDASRRKAEDEAAVSKAVEEKKRVEEEAAAASQAEKSQPTTAAPSGTTTPAEAAAPAASTKRPEPLDLSKSAAVSEEVITAPGSALSQARIIEDLSAVTYPDSVKTPDPALNQAAKPGKYRYDREFLLQFMAICKEKPVQLPSLEELGMTDEGPPSAGVGMPRAVSHGGKSRTGPGSVSSTPMGARGMPPSINRAVSSGFAGMGNFSAPNPAALSSAERFAAASSGSLPGRPMARTPSTTGGIPMGGPSGRGGDRRSGRGTRRGPPIPTPSQIPSDFAPLELSENRWTPTVQARSSKDQPEDSPEVVDRKVKALLNKLTIDNFDSISKQILEWANKSAKEQDGRILKQVIALIFEKATDEATWSAVYAKLCAYLDSFLSTEVADQSIKEANGAPVAGGRLFRRYLLTRCQADYERGWAQKESATAAAKGKAADDKAKKEAIEKEAEAAGADKEAAVKGADFSDEYYAAEKAKRRGLGLVRFIGELFKLGMLKERIMHECFKKLLADLDTPEEEDIESLCRLLLTVGQKLETTGKDGHAYMDIYFTRLQTIVDKKTVSSRLVFMILDVMDARKHGWRSKAAPSGPKSIAEVHQDAARQREEEARRASQGKGLPSRIPMERGGSRRGQGREAGPDGWQNAPAPRPQKAGDLTTLGKIRSSSGSPALGMLGKAGGAKAPAKEENPKSNPFALLAGAGEEKEPEAMSPPAESARRPLQLQPRSKPTEDDKDKATAEEEEGEVKEEAEPAEAGEMDEATKRSIDNSVQEYLSVKMVDEAQQTFEALPAAHRGALAKAFIDKAVGGKVDVFTAVLKLFKTLGDAQVIPSDIFREAFVPTVTDLEDIAGDAPKAWSNVANLLKAAKLAKEDVEVLQKSMISNEDMLEDIQNQLMEEYEKASP